MGEGEVNPDADVSDVVDDVWTDTYKYMPINEVIARPSLWDLKSMGSHKNTHITTANRHKWKMQ